jgi:hypothetical protein
MVLNYIQNKKGPENCYEFFNKGEKGVTFQAFIQIKK